MNLEKIQAEINELERKKRTLLHEEHLNDARPVLITTEFRGVFFGYANDTDGDTVTLYDARNCIYWSSDVGGFMGLAETGPTKSCRIGPKIEKIELRKVTSVAEIQDDALKAWASAGVYRG